MESPRERACPSCAAPAAADQRWCLECGAELPQRGRAGLRSAVGIATTVAVLVGAASAGGYTLLRDGKQPPPPAQTVAAAPAPTTTSLPPATQETPSYPAGSSSTYTPSYPSYPSYPSGTGGTTGGAKAGGATHSGHGGGQGANGTGTGTNGNGSATDTTREGEGTGTIGQGGGATQPPPPVETNVALGAAAVVYAPYTPADADLGDATRVVDGTTRTGWKTPAAADPTAPPQIGVYVDLAGRTVLHSLILRTPTPGMSIEVYGALKGPPATIVDPGWDHLATRKDLKSRTTIALPARPFRYVLVWIVGLPPGASRAAISELALRSLQPA